MCVMVAAVGCSAPQMDEGNWTQAGTELQTLGVDAYRVDAQNDVSLRGPDAQVIGRVTLTVTDDSTTVFLKLKGTTWQQVIVPATGQMTVTLDGQPWTMDQSKSFVRIVQLVGVEANLAPAPASSSASAEAKPGSSAKPDLGSGPSLPPLACSDVVVTGSGWGWYWEEKPQGMACKRANDALSASCLASSTHDCCNVAKQCDNCVDWGTGYACSTLGYLQYQPLH
jgi:hypothetical protein